MMSNIFEGFNAENNNKLINTQCDFNNQAKKRKLDESMETFSENMMIRGRSFLPIRGGTDVFATDEWKSSGTSLFCPVKQDVYLNLQKYDQISAAQGSFYTADDCGNFQSSVIGHVIHLWRFDKKIKKLYISQSYLFTNQQEFLRVQAFLQNL
ncbi:hypothetical protein ACF0H5_005046 [Mactra antiquata]